MKGNSIPCGKYILIENLQILEYGGKTQTVVGYWIERYPEGYIYCPESFINGTGLGRIPIGFLGGVSRKESRVLEDVVEAEVNCVRANLEIQKQEIQKRLEQD